MSSFSFFQADILSSLIESLKDRGYNLFYNPWNETIDITYSSNKVLIGGIPLSIAKTYIEDFIRDVDSKKADMILKTKNLSKLINTKYNGLYITEKNRYGRGD